MANPSTHTIMSISDIAQTVGLGVTILLFGIQSWLEGRRRDKADADALVATKIQIYQTLEIESNAIFRFEAEHKYILPFFKSNLAPKGLYNRTDIVDKDKSVVTEAEMKLLARKYYELTCNLFEVASRLRKAGFADAEVFGSWIAWYFDTLLEWGFRAAWDGLRTNYTRDLRRIFDPFVARLVREWDVPHAAGTPLAFAGEEEETGREVDEAAILQLKADFYCEVSKLFGNMDEKDDFDREVEQLSRKGASYSQCIHIRDWLKVAEETAPKPRHPMAYG